MRNPFRVLKAQVSPYGRLRRMLEQQMFQVRECPRLAALKDMHKGERCFLIGNGPSLRQHDLWKLIGERTFVTNMFMLHELAREIVPSYYCIADWIHWSKESGFTAALRQGFRDLVDCTFFFEYDARRVATRTPELKNRRVYYLFQEEATQTVWDGNFTTDARRPLFWGRTVMIDFCIPLACYMGFKDIYLIGNDYNWNVEKSSNLQSAYFYDIKRDDRKLTESVAHKSGHFEDPQHVVLIMKAFEVVKKELEATGHRIYNAGYGGRLEVFPRVNYDDLF